MEDKIFHPYASYDEYMDLSLLQSNKNILNCDNDYLLGNKIDGYNDILCTGDDNHEPKRPIIDGIQVLLDVAGVLGPLGAIPDVINGIIYLCRGDLDSMKFSLISILTPIPSGIAKGTANASNYANKVTAKGYVFWSGGNKARKAAEDFAKKNGFTTLEMTSKGQKVERKVNNKYLKHIYKQSYSEALDVVKKKGIKNQDEINAYIKNHMNSIRDLVEEAKNGDYNQLHMLLGNLYPKVPNNKWISVENWGSQQFSIASEHFAIKAARSGKELHNFRLRKYNPFSIWIVRERKILDKFNRFSRVHLVK